MTEEQLERFRKLDGQLASFVGELGKLASSSPDGSVDQIKVRLLNQLLSEVDEFLGEALRPFDGPVDLSSDTSNSDAVVVLGQYRACTAEYRRRNTTRRYGKEQWVVEDPGGKSGESVRYVPVETEPQDS